MFAPVQKLGLIVIDDEAHIAYKEARAPRFHARTVAAERARRADATLVLVGMPPSLEAWSATLRGPYTLVSPTRDVERKTRPAVTVVDEQTRLVPAAKTMTLAKQVLAEGKRVVVLTHRAGEEAQRVAERVFRILSPHQPAVLDAKTPRAGLKASALSVGTEAAASRIEAASAVLCKAAERVNSGPIPRITVRVVVIAKVKRLFILCLRFVGF